MYEIMVRRRCCPSTISPGWTQVAEIDAVAEKDDRGRKPSNDGVYKEGLRARLPDVPTLEHWLKV